MDVLQYTAFNQQVEYQKQIREKEDCYRTLVNEKVAASGGGGGTAALVCWLEKIEPCLLYNPVNFETEGVPSVPKYWDCIPQGDGWSGGIKVCDATGYYRCGRNCNWTVPSGVTCARFQLWGAGGGSSSARNFSDSLFGSTGAYASAIIPVSAGEVYCMCAGCAYCCYATAGACGRVPGCPSYVIGPRFCWFCAEGGEGTMSNWAGHIGKCSVYRLAPACCADSGACFCYYGNMTCHGGGGICYMCKGPLDFVPGSMYGGCINNSSSVYSEEGLSENSIVYGIRGIWGCYCHDNSHYGWNVHPPIYGFEMNTMCCDNWTSGNCCGNYCGAWAGNGCLRYPGAGGWGTHMWGGDGGCGDAGKFGMVCVSYK